MGQIATTDHSFGTALLATLSLSLGANAQAESAIKQEQRALEIVDLLEKSDDSTTWEKGLETLIGMRGELSPRSCKTTSLKRILYKSPASECYFLS